MRNIVLIVVDTLRADHLGCYGYHRPTSPFLDSLAARSLVLDACYSASNFTARLRVAGAEPCVRQLAQQRLVHHRDVRLDAPDGLVELR